MGERDWGQPVYVEVLARDVTNEDPGSPHLSTVGYNSDVNR